MVGLNGPTAPAQHRLADPGRSARLVLSHGSRHEWGQLTADRYRVLSSAVDRVAASQGESTIEPIGAGSARLDTDL
jgi:hypothetical protein